MMGVLLICHENLGQAHQQLLKHFFPEGEVHHWRCLGVKPTDDHDSILRQAQGLLEEMACDGVLVLTDIFGATPCNASSKLLSLYPACVLLTGLNAPMLIKAITHAPKTNDLAQLARLVQQAGQEGIMLIQG